VASWYHRLADAWSENMPELQAALAGTFLRAWVDNRNPNGAIQFDAPSHLRACNAVLEVRASRRDVFLTTETARLSGGGKKWAGALPRIQGLFGALLLAISCPALAEVQLTAVQAKSHVGEKAKVCGTVASAKYLPRSKGMPTFLNLDKPFPDQIFTAVIWGHDRPRFPTPPESWGGSIICVSGFITSYRDVPEIIVNHPSQISR
jgi:hypothetical protein